MRRHAGTLASWIGALAAIGVITTVARVIHINPTTVGFAYLLIVLFSSVRSGLFLGTLVSVIATLCLNLFFFPPYYTLRLDDPANWFALAAFLATSVTVSRLVVATRRQAEQTIALALEREQFLEENAHVQALRESEAFKTSLLRAISHDLRSPVTAIRIRTESVRRGAGTNRALLDDANAITEEAGRLGRRIDNLLAMAQLEAGRARPRPEPTPAADLFRATRENLPLVFNNRPMTIEVQEDCPDANVDPALALEILVNLVENADRAAPAGTPIELVARSHPADTRTVRLEIRDRGPGLPPGIADANGSVRVETSDVAQRGLGLEIARSLAVANGGSLSLWQRAGGGTIARVDLPAALLTAEQPAIEEAPA